MRLDLSTVPSVCKDTQRQDTPKKEDNTIGNQSLHSDCSGTFE